MSLSDFAKEWVIDAGMTTPAGLFCFVPVEGMDSDSPTFVIGLSLISDRCPGVLRGVIHEDGQAAVEAFIEANREMLESLKQ